MSDSELPEGAEPLDYDWNEHLRDADRTAAAVIIVVAPDGSVLRASVNLDPIQIVSLLSLAVQDAAADLKDGGLAGLLGHDDVPPPHV